MKFGHDLKWLKLGDENMGVHYTIMVILEYV